MTPIRIGYFSVRENTSEIWGHLDYGNMGAVRLPKVDFSSNARETPTSWSHRTSVVPPSSRRCGLLVPVFPSRHACESACGRPVTPQTDWAPLASQQNSPGDVRCRSSTGSLLAGLRYRRSILVEKETNMKKCLITAALEVHIVQGPRVF